MSLFLQMVFRSDDGLQHMVCPGVETQESQPLAGLGDSPEYTAVLEQLSSPSCQSGLTRLHHQSFGSPSVSPRHVYQSSIQATHRAAPSDENKSCYDVLFMDGSWLVLSPNISIIVVGILQSRLYNDSRSNRLTPTSLDEFGTTILVESHSSFNQVNQTSHLNLNVLNIQQHVRICSHCIY